MNAGTHDVMNISITVLDGIHIQTNYYLYSNATGALFNFVFTNQNFEVQSTQLVINRNIMNDYILPFNLHPGLYNLFVYDIEYDGTLQIGVSYPAVTKEITVATIDKSKAIVRSLDDVYFTVPRVPVPVFLLYFVFKVLANLIIHKQGGLGGSP